jgi:hypothetical protein
MNFGVKMVIDGKPYERAFNVSRNNVVLEMFIDSARMESSFPIELTKKGDLPKKLTDTCRYFAHITGVGTLEMTYEEYRRAITELNCEIEEEKGKIDAVVDELKKEMTECSNNLAQHIQELQRAVESTVNP